jgi:protoporphyrinogen oxidase
MTSSTQDLIIIGGGLSGLAAAYEAQQHNRNYTLIEVKGRLGGSIITHHQGGFVLDGGAFAFPQPETWPTLHELGLSDALIPVTRKHGPPYAAFADGTQTLTDALATRLTGTIIKRMAVTSLGAEPDGTYTVCLENGIALTARGVVVAVPALRAERIFRTLAPAIAEQLQGYHYDTVTRVALGYTAANRPEKVPSAPPDMTFAALYNSQHPARVPDGGLLLQVALRLPLAQLGTDGVVRRLLAGRGWPQPDVVEVHDWATSDPLSVTGPPNAIHDINAQLPAGVQVAGNCYEFLELPARTAAGRQAARTVIASLG